MTTTDRLPTDSFTVLPPPRRVVTGHDTAGRSVFLSAEPPPQFHGRQKERVRFHEIWNTASTPVPLEGGTPEEPNRRLPLRIPPDPNGSIIRILDIYPGHVQALAPRADGRHPGMHRTETLDYGILIKGELYLILDNDDEVKLEPGDVAVQRGTDHAWENRSNDVARIAFVLLDGRFTGPLAEQLSGAQLMHETLSLRAQGDGSHR